MQTKVQKRIILLDVMRIILAFFVFFRHSITIIGCPFGPRIQTFVLSSTSFIMTAFFVLSGFSLYLVYENKDLFDIKNVGEFYKKRFVGIFPAYFLITVFWVLLNHSIADIKIFVKLLPAELSMIQSQYNSLFTFIHNGGTWFVSCLIACYFVFPLVLEIIKIMSFRYRIILLVVLAIFPIYTYYLTLWCGLASTYSMPFFRFVEFLTGVLLCSLRKPLLNWNNIKIKVRNIVLVFIMLALTIISAYVIYKNISFTYMPLMCAVILLSSVVSIPIIDKSKLIPILSNASYVFFLLQCYLNNPLVLKVPPKYRFIVVLIGLVVLSIAINVLYEKPIKKIILKKKEEKING